MENSNKVMDPQEEKSVQYLKKVLDVDESIVTVFLPFNLIKPLIRKHRSCINYLKNSRGYNIHFEIQ